LVQAAVLAAAAGLILAALRHLVSMEQFQWLVAALPLIQLMPSAVMPEPLTFQQTLI